MLVIIEPINTIISFHYFIDVTNIIINFTNAILLPLLLLFKVHKFTNNLLDLFLENGHKPFLRNFPFPTHGHKAIYSKMLSS